MLDNTQMMNQSPSASALLLFDRVQRINSIKDDIVRAAQHLNSLPDHHLAELGLNRSEIEDTIDRYI